MSRPPEESHPGPMTAPRIELVCPGCRRVGEYPAEGRGREVTCPHCAHRFPAPESVPVIYLPWEDRGNLGWFRALWETVRISLLAPRTFFSRMPISGGWFSPVSYAAIVGGLALAVRSLAAVALLGTGSTAGLQPQDLAALKRMHLTLAVLAPVGAVLTTLSFAALVHLTVLVVGGAEPSLQTTARVVCYAGSAQLLMVIPWIGAPLGALWVVVLTVIGLREAQELSTGKAVVAALAPVLLLLMLVLGPCQRAPAGGPAGGGPAVGGPPGR